jgi:hypothetical protein
MGAASEVGWQRRRRRGRGWEEEGDVGGWEVGGIKNCEWWAMKERVEGIWMREK